MVKDSGKTLRADTYQQINAPEPVRVEEDNTGCPVAVRLPRRQGIIIVDDRWRIDDEWWRTAPIARLYWAVRLASGHRLVIYKDLNDGRWYRQSY